MGVAVGGSGGLYLVGETLGTLPGQTHAGNWDVFVVKLSPGETVPPNTPTTADAGRPYAITEDGGLTLDASASSDPDGDTLTYSWDVNGDVTFGDAIGVTPTLTWGQLGALGIGDGPNTHAVRVRVSDGTGNVVASEPTTLVVTNVAPTATLTNDGPVLDGEPATVQFIDAYDHSAADLATLRYAFALDPAALETVTYATAGTNPSAVFTFAEGGIHTVYGRVIDKDGGYSQYSTAIEVIALQPAIGGFVVNAGAAQRSNVERVEVRFNRATNVPDLIASGAIVDSVQLFGTNRIILDARHFQYHAATTTLIVDLTVDGFGGSRATLLGDGRFQLRLDTAAITARGVPGNGLLDDDGEADGWASRDFHRLEGDYDGDGVVSLLDRSLFLAHYGIRVGQGAYDFIHDLDGDGVVGLADYPRRSKRIGRRV